MKIAFTEKMKPGILIGSCFLLIGLWGCGGKVQIKEEIPCAVQFDAAKAKYEAAKYEKAKDAFHQLLYKCSGSTETPRIIFYLGMTYFKLKSFDQAEFQFRDIIRDYRSDSLAEAAQFMVGKSLFFQSRSSDRDQTETRTALTEFQTCLDEFPGGALADSAKTYIKECRDKLAYKELSSGIIYQKMQEYKAAVIYFRNLLNEFPDSKWCSQAKYELAYSLFKNKQKAEALETCKDLLANQPPEEIAIKADKLRQQIEK
jgi:outer membrane protein assembly factor BamD